MGAARGLFHAEPWLFSSARQSRQRGPLPILSVHPSSYPHCASGTVSRGSASASLTPTLTSRGNFRVSNLHENIHVFGVRGEKPHHCGFHLLLRKSLTAPRWKMEEFYYKTQAVKCNCGIPDCVGLPLHHLAIHLEIIYIQDDLYTVYIILYTLFYIHCIAHDDIVIDQKINLQCIVHP